MWILLSLVAAVSAGCSQKTSTVVHVELDEYCRCLQGMRCYGNRCTRHFMPDQTTAEVFEYPASCDSCSCALPNDHTLPVPRLQAKWQQFASDHGCETDSDWWLPVDRQVYPFRHVGITKRMLDSASRLPRTRTCSTKHLDVCWPNEIRDIVASVTRYIDVELFLVFNELDEPRVLAPSREHSYDMDVRLVQMLQSDNVDSVRILCARHPAFTRRNEGHAFLFRPGTTMFTFSLVPVFGDATMQGCFADIAVPTGYGDSLREEPPANLEHLTWENKIDKLLWRGTSTGALHLESDYDLRQTRHRHREHIHQTLRHNVSDYDIGIVDWLQCSSAELCKYLARNLGTVDRVPSEQYGRYRYLLDMDGNSFSQRYVHLLRHTESLVFRMSLFDQWETLLTRPMVHYVPVAFNPDSVAEMLRWARQNDADARSIARAGHAFARERLRRNDAACYWFRILMQYEDACVTGTMRDNDRYTHIQSIKRAAT